MKLRYISALQRSENFSEDLVVLSKPLVHLRKALINGDMKIPTPHFLLREPKSQKPTLISCYLRFNNVL
jgi:hypothetical protein